MGQRFLSEKNDVDVQKTLTAMVMYETLPEVASYLEDEGISTTVEKLEVWRDRMYADRLQKRRAELAPVIEARLAADMLDNATLASDVTRLAIAKTRDMLEAGRVADPSRVARDLSQVATQAVDKRLALQGRPTQIVEHRDTAEIIRKLEGMGVAVQAESAAIDSTAIEETSVAQS
jgi:hypothetical protein